MSYPDEPLVFDFGAGVYIIDDGDGHVLGITRDQYFALCSAEPIERQTMKAIWLAEAQRNETP